MKFEDGQLDRFLKHQQETADAYNTATPEVQKQMQGTLTQLKALRVSSVGGLRGIFPALRGRLTVTQEGMKNG